MPSLYTPWKQRGRNGRAPSTLGQGERSAPRPGNTTPVPAKQNGWGPPGWDSNPGSSNPYSPHDYEYVALKILTVHIIIIIIIIIITIFITLSGLM